MQAVEDNPQYGPDILSSGPLELDIREPADDKTEYYIKLELQIWTICPPILLITGTIGNLLSGNEII